VTPTPETGLLVVAAADGKDLLTAAERDWSRPVPDCPGWTAADLVGHMGAILGWIARIVSTGAEVPRRDRETPPADPGELPAWYGAHLDSTLSILAATEPGSLVWTFSSRGDHRAGWWCRRLAVEVAIHRWDMQRAAGPGLAGPPPVHGTVAAAGIEEFLTEFLPGLLSRPGIAGLTGSVQMDATDGDCGWWIDLDRQDRVVAVAGRRPADMTIRATRSDLLLWLTNRRGPAALDILGPPEVAARWVQLCR
jgi:uncharacterized protein (TIGR03083 family)